MTRRDLSLVLGLCACPAILAGCGGGEDPTKPDPCRDSICAAAGAGGGGGSGGAGGSAGGSGGSAGASATGGGPGSGGSGGSGPLANLDLDFYKCNVEPIVDRSCAMLGCHGDAKNPFRVYVIYARGRLRNDELVDNTGTCLKSGKVNLNKEGTGTVMCEGWLPHTAAEWQMNYDSARKFLAPGYTPEETELLLQPTEGMGFAHVGVHPFKKDDASYTTIKRWLSGETLGAPCNPEPN